MDTAANGESASEISVSPVHQDKKPRKEKGSKKREDKSLDHVLKSLAHLPTADEKLQMVCAKYSQVADEFKQQQSNHRMLEKRLVLVQREKEQIQGEQTKCMLTKSRLEQLCRELQKQNKAMKEESMQRIREEEEKRKEVSAKFHSTLAEITSLMQQNSESNSKLRDENLSIQKQFKGVCEQYELREQQVEKMAQQMKLEGQLSEAKIAKAKLELQAEKDMSERDKAELTAQLVLCQQKCLDHEQTEAALRAQINVYFEKYDEFQNVLTKSNTVYAGFKTEMEKMSKKITRLEKETASWKQKWESTHKALLALAAEKQAKDTEVAQQARQLTQLQKLCRTMQAERSVMLAQLYPAAKASNETKAEVPENSPNGVDIAGKSAENIITLDEADETIAPATAGNKNLAVSEEVTASIKVESHTTAKDISQSESSNNDKPNAEFLSNSGESMAPSSADCAILPADVSNRQIQSSASQSTSKSVNPKDKSREHSDKKSNENAPKSNNKNKQSKTDEKHNVKSSPGKKAAEIANSRSKKASSPHAETAKLDESAGTCGKNPSEVGNESCDEKEKLDAEKPVTSTASPSLSGSSIKETSSSSSSPNTSATVSSDQATESKIESVFIVSTGLQSLESSASLPEDKQAFTEADFAMCLEQSLILNKSLVDAVGARLAAENSSESEVEMPTDGMQSQSSNETKSIEDQAAFTENDYATCLYNYLKFNEPTAGAGLSKNGSETAEMPKSVEANESPITSAIETKSPTLDDRSTLESSPKPANFKSESLTLGAALCSAGDNNSSTQSVSATLSESIDQLVPQTQVTSSSNETAKTGFSSTESSENKRVLIPNKVDADVGKLILEAADVAVDVTSQASFSADSNTDAKTANPVCPIADPPAEIVKATCSAPSLIASQTQSSNAAADVTSKDDNGPPAKKSPNQPEPKKMKDGGRRRKK